MPWENSRAGKIAGFYPGARGDSVTRGVEMSAGHETESGGTPLLHYFFFTAEYSVRLKSTYSGERSEV
jgi:hypothetical protein